MNNAASVPLLSAQVALYMVWGPPVILALNTSQLDFKWFTICYLSWVVSPSLRILCSVIHRPVKCWCHGNWGGPEWAPSSGVARRNFLSVVCAVHCALHSYGARVLAQVDKYDENASSVHST